MGVMSASGRLNACAMRVMMKERGADASPGWQTGRDANSHDVKKTLRHGKELNRGSRIRERVVFSPCEQPQWSNETLWAMTLWVLPPAIKEAMWHEHKKAGRLRRLKKPPALRVGMG